MFKRIGLGGFLTLNTGSAVAAMQTASAKLAQLRQSFITMGPSIRSWRDQFIRATQYMRDALTKLKMGLASVAAGLKTTAMAALPLSYGMWRGLKFAANFESQIATVGAVCNASAEDMDKLRVKAKKMGITTVYTATQAAEAMEYLARAGATADESISALDGVMAVAAADGMDLASAADVVAIVTKSMGREWDKAGRIADILAKTSASSNTNVLLLRESFVYGASAAKAMNMSLEETSAIFGALGDAGLKGSIAGTSFMNMMNKIGDPSERAAKILKKWNIQLTQADGNLRPFSDIISQMAPKFLAIKNVVERNAVGVEIFGLRGVKAFNALMVKGAGPFQKLLDKITDSEGAALIMAERRLNTLKGRYILFESALQGTMVELFEPMLQPWAQAFKGTADSMNQVLEVVQMFKDKGDALPTLLREWEKEVGSVTVAQVQMAAKLGGWSDEQIARYIQLERIGRKYGETAQQMGKGFVDATEWMKEVWEGFKNSVLDALDRFTKSMGGEGMRTFTKWTIKVVVATAVLGPLTLVIGGLVWVLKAGLWPVVRGLAVSVLALAKALAITLGKAMLAVTKGAFLLLVRLITLRSVGILPLIATFLKVALVAAPVLGIMALLVGAFSTAQDRSAGFGATMQAVWEGLKNTLGAFIGGFVSTLGDMWTAAKKVFLTIWHLLESMFGWIWDSSSSTGQTMKEAFGDAGSFIGKVFVGALEIVAKTFQALNEWILESRVSFQEEMYRMHLGIINLQRAVGAMSEQEYQTQLRRMAHTKRMIAEEKDKTTAMIAQRRKELAELDKMNQEAAARRVGGEKAALKKAPVNVNLDVNDKRVINNKTQVNVDGKMLGESVTRHELQMQERAGFKSTPWRRRAALQHGAVSLAAGGG